MGVFTIFNCGTDSNRDSAGEIVADIGKELAGLEYTDYLINDGPGSHGIGMRSPGKFDPFTQDRSKATKKSVPSKDDVRGWFGEAFPKTKGDHYILRPLTARFADDTHSAITGHGWDHNVIHSVETIRNLTENGVAIRRINMLGWSRGAVTCLRVANWLERKLGENFEVNIFAVDPVAGVNLGIDMWDTRTVPKSVKKYVGILAMNERRGDFLPQDGDRLFRDANASQIAFLPFPGDHQTVVTEQDGEIPEVNQMVRDLARRFLVHCGTRFSVSHGQLPPRDCCELYAAMKQKAHKYKSIGKGIDRGMYGGTVKRKVRTHVQEYIGADSQFFVNDHHRMCFQQEYNAVYTYFFGRHWLPGGTYRINETVMGRAVEGLRVYAPKSYRLLADCYQVRESVGAFELPPSGVKDVGTIAHLPTKALVEDLVRPASNASG